MGMLSQEAGQNCNYFFDTEVKLNLIKEKKKYVFVIKVHICYFCFIF